MADTVLLAGIHNFYDYTIKNHTTVSDRYIPKTCKSDNSDDLAHNAIEIYGGQLK